MKRRDLEQLLRKNGFVFLRNTRHCVWYRQQDNCTIIVPMHREIKPLVAKGILKMAKILTSR